MISTKEHIFKPCMHEYIKNVVIYKEIEQHLYLNLWLSKMKKLILFCTRIIRKNGINKKNKKKEITYDRTALSVFLPFRIREKEQVIHSIVLKFH